MRPSAVLALLAAPIFASAEPVSEGSGGITFQFPEESRDRVEPLFGDFIDWRESMRAKLDQIEENIQAEITGEASEEKVMEFLGTDLGLGSAPPQAFVKAYRASALDAARLAPAWSPWLGGFDTIRFWSRDEAGNRYDPETGTYDFGDLSDAKEGALSIQPQAL